MPHVSVPSLTGKHEIHSKHYHPGKRNKNQLYKGGEREDNHNIYHNDNSINTDDENTTAGVWHNLPVLWLIVRASSALSCSCSNSRPVEVALTLGVGHAVQCVVSVPGR